MHRGEIFGWVCVDSEATTDAMVLDVTGAKLHGTASSGGVGRRERERAILSKAAFCRVV